MSEQYVPGSEGAKSQYDFVFMGRVIVLDNGARLVLSSRFKPLMDLGTFSIVSFDPAGKLNGKEELKDFAELQIVNNIILADGNPVTYYACLNNDVSSCLEPMPGTLGVNPEGGVDPILAKVSVPSIRLNDVEDMKSLDLAILDDLHDNVAILENGDQQFKNTLLFDVRVPLKPTHFRQSDFCQISYWMAQNNFSFLRFHSFNQTSKLPENESLEYSLTSQMISSRVLFLPSEEKLKKMTENQLIKLSFILHTMYGLKDAAYHVLNIANPDKARDYLVAEGILWPVDTNETEFTLTSEYSPDIWVV